jgi:putative nucleotidyltransferase with HDIG domain
LDRSTPPEYLQAAIAFAALGLFAHYLSHGLARGATGSIAFIPFVTAALLAPGWIAVAAVTGSIVLIEAVQKRTWVKRIFNVSQHALSVALAVSAYLLLGGSSLLPAGSFSVVPYLALFVTFLFANTLAVSGAVAVSERVSIWQVWRQNTLKSLGYDLLTLPVAYFFAWFYREHSIIGAFSLAIPLIGFRQLYKTHWQLARSHEDLLRLMPAVIEARDPYTSGHSKRVARNARLIARMIGLSGKHVDQIGVAALLHDVGKIYEVFAPILRSPDRLTPEQWEIMKTHPAKGAELVQEASHLRHAVAVIRSHHENWDGTGYPDGLAGEDIPLGARIIIFADTIDAMTSDRPYRKAMTAVEVHAEIVRMRGRQFDPTIADAILSSRQFGALFEEGGQSQSVPAFAGERKRAMLLTPQFVPAMFRGRKRA